MAGTMRHSCLYLGRTQLFDHDSEGSSDWLSDAVNLCSLSLLLSILSPAQTLSALSRPTSLLTVATIRLFGILFPRYTPLSPASPRFLCCEHTGALPIPTLSRSHSVKASGPATCLPPTSTTLTRPFAYESCSFSSCARNTFGSSVNPSVNPATATGANCTT